MSSDIAAGPDGLSRRAILLGTAGIVGAAALSGCASVFGGSLFDTAEIYGPLPDEQFPIPAVDVDGVDTGLLRQTVRYDTSEPEGTIVVDLPNHHLYRVEAEGFATRYGVNGPRDPFLWSGVAVIQRKAEWPVWTPTPDQIGRDPSLVQYAGGMPPGLTNPLGARALYLYQDGRDTLCRIYGTDQPWTLGMGVSSGCIGLLNQDVIDLYRRTPVGTRVIIRQA